MYHIGVLYGKFTPPHIGHLNAILRAATMCETLYVVLSDNPVLTKDLCKKDNLPYMDEKLRMKWLSKELQEFEHIHVILLDETGIDVYPNGWDMWSKRLEEVVPEKFDVIFGGEREYETFNKHYFPYATYELYDCDRTEFPISATKIRSNPILYWNSIIPSARPFFAKKILITGTESCGKTTMAQYLARIFQTVCTVAEGR